MIAPAVFPSCLLVAFAASCFAPIAAAQDAPLRTEAVRPFDAGRPRATGRILPVWSADVGARVAGRITSWGTDAASRPIDVGSRVARGAELFRVDPSVYASRRDALAAALASAEARRDDLRAGVRPEQKAALAAAVAAIDVRLADLRRDEDRFRRLVEVDRSVPQKRLDEIRTALGLAEAERSGAVAKVAEAEAGPTKTALSVADAMVREAAAAVASAELDLRDCVVTAPFDAVVLRRARTLGDYVNNAPFTEVLGLASYAELEAELRLPESFRPSLAPGSAVTLTGPLLAEPLTLPLDRLLGAVDAADGTVSFRVRIPAESRGGLCPGAYVAGLLTSVEAGAVVVPAGAVDRSGRSPAVFVVRGGLLRRVDVVVRDRLTDGAVVVGELSAGERVVADVRTGLKDGDPAPAEAPKK